MGLLDKLIDKVIDSAKKKKADNVIKKLEKENPEFAKAVQNHADSVKKLESEIESLLKKRGMKP